MTLSVVIPVYNGERLLGRTLKSLLARCRCRGELEVIVVDDGSDDGTRGVVREWQKEWVPLRLLTNPLNMGPDFSRKRGVEEAAGEWVLMADAGDTFSPRFADVVVSRLRKADPTVGCYVTSVSQVASRLPLRLPFWEPSRYFGERAEVGSLQMLDDMLGGQKCPCTLWHKIFRTSLFSARPLKRFGERYGEDLLANIELFSIPFRVGMIPEAVYRWHRDGPSNMSPRRQWHADKMVGRYVMEFARNIFGEESEMAASAAQSVYSNFVRSIARQLVRPATGRRELHRWIEEELTDEVFAMMPETIGPRDPMTDGRRLLKAHYKGLLAEMLLIC